MGAQQKIINDGNSFVALCSSFFARTHAKKKECDRIENRFRVFARTRIKKKKDRNRVQRNGFVSRTSAYW